MLCYVMLLPIRLIPIKKISRTTGSYSAERKVESEIMLLPEKHTHTQLDHIFIYSKLMSTQIIF
jgi:hypothetical protein